MAEWIPTSERLPEEKDLYLCTFKSGCVADALYEGDAYWTDELGEGFNYDVIAWMPLPEPYEGEKINENH